MFNDVNNPANQNRQAVDDIFADTDKAQDSVAAGVAAPRPGGAEIDTQRIGLTATDEYAQSAPEKKSQEKLFKIIIILIIVVVLGLAGYLVYSKFLNAPVVETPAPVIEKKTVPAVTTTPNDTSFVEMTGDLTATASSTGTIIPGVNAPAATSTAVVPASLIDSDSDGLTDAEEKAAGTNINIIDTDNDGLSDYEEVIIYKTNPISADTDGDGYLDGAEVKGGYNPNGAGKLAGSTATSSAAIK